MTDHKTSKINNLLKIWPKGTVATQTWLNTQGVSRFLAQRYVEADWINRIGKSAFVRSGEKVGWTGGLCALQKQSDLSVHIAAKTALEMHGHAHFIPLGRGYRVWLFKAHDEKRELPVWMHEYFINDVQITCLTRRLFQNDEDEGLTTKQIGDYEIVLSSREQAMMEYLDLVPGFESYSQAVYLMDGLKTLRPNLVQVLLENCRSVKVKRLFMYLAEEANHAWVNHVNLSKVNFGSGKRVISGGGKFYPKYNLSVPKEQE